MKKILFSLIFVLTLQNSAHADEVKDFQIEGISLGDSLLEHINILGVSKNDILQERSDVNLFLIYLIFDDVCFFCIFVWGW